MIARLRAALVAADYRYAPVAGLLGELAHAALGRNETVPGLRETRDGGPLATLVRLFLLQSPVERGAAERALPGLLDELSGHGFLAAAAGEVRALIDLRPYATEEQELWVAADLTPGLDGGPGRVEPDHVLGISPAATSLAQLTVRRSIGDALDLGTGCGVQSLHLARHAGHVVATDVNRRALELTRFNAALNEIELEIREGSFFEPVAGRRFDLVVTNPPFVISPATEEQLVYRDSGIPGDAAVEQLVSGISGHLNPGGIGQVLANWAHRSGEPWQQRLADWVGADTDLWVVQREVLDPAEYVELWLKDAGLHGAPQYRERYDDWLAWFDRQRIEAVGFGWFTLRRREGTDGPPHRLLEEWPWEVAQPLGAEIGAHLDRVAELGRLRERDLLAAELRCRPDVQQETVGAPGAEEPATVLLRQQTGMRRARQVSTAEAALVGACDGDLAVGDLIAGVARLVEGTDTAALLATVRELIVEGYLEFASS